MRPLSLRHRGYLLSVELDSRLVPDVRWLRLYDRSGHLHLTEAEVAEQRAEAEARQARIEAQRAEVAEQRARLLTEKLRALGVDPDQP